MTDALATLTRSYDGFRALGLPHARALDAAQAVIAVLRDLERADAERRVVRLQQPARGNYTREVACHGT